MTLGAEAVLADNELLTSLGLTSAQARLFLTMSARRLNAPTTTSMGRLFDGLAALVLGIHRVEYEGQAAARLESCADAASDAAYRLDADGDWAPLIAAVLRERRCGIPAPVIAGRFHQALANWAAALAAQHPDVPIVLGGGCFQNRLLLEKTLSALHAGGRRVHHASLVPPGDGGLAVGQLAVALATLDRGGA
jgi:hydrogenase maturation protein HypF